MHTTKINKRELDSRVREKANLILDTLNENNINYFPCQARDIALAMLDDYTYEIYQHFTEGPDKIADAEVYNRFIDYLEGYRHQMRQWIDEYPINVVPCVEIPMEPEAPRKPMSAWVPASVGAAVTVGLVIFAPIWAALVAVAATGLALIAKRHGDKKRQKMYEAERRQYLAKMEETKGRLVDGLLNDLGQWLDKGIEASEKILAQYGIN